MIVTLASIASLSANAFAPPGLGVRRTVVVSDGTNISVVVTGKSDAEKTLVFVPGWSMPSAIFAPQVFAFAEKYQIVLIDPRGQGESEIPASGYIVERRARDIYDVLSALKLNDVVLVAWSLGVLEVLKFTDQHPDYALKGLVLIDNSVGESTPPKSNPNFFSDLRKKRNETVSAFVRSMFQQPQQNIYLSDLARQAQRLPVESSIRLLSYPVPREFWRAQLYAFTPPVAYFVTPKFAAQAAAVKEKRPQTTTRIFPNAGHAIFADDPAAFNAALSDFLNTLQ